MEKVMIKKVEEAPKVVEVDELTLEYMQGIVGGYIEMPYLSEALDSRKIDIVINEEGKLEGLEPNMMVMHKGQIVDIVVGDMLFVANDGQGNTIGLDDKQLEYLKELFEHHAVLTNRGMFHYVELEGDDM